MTRDERDMLLVRYLDGSASVHEVESLNALLKDDPEARASLREMAGQAVAMADLARERAIHMPPARTEPSEPTSKRRKWYGRLAVAAMLLIGVGLGVWQLRSRAEEVTVAQVSGAVSWASEGGQPQGGLTEGARVRAGTITVEGAASSAKLAFRDGSTITLMGDSELALSGDSRKRLTLRRGALTADVHPQPAGSPMVVRTPTAEIEVLGTRFLLLASPGQSTLSVEAGIVRLRRLVDGGSVDVTSGHVFVATLDTAAKLEPLRLPPAPTKWRQTFDQPPPSTWQGEWVAADASNPGRLRNVLDVSYRRGDGTVVPAHVVTVRSISGDLAAVQPDSLLRLRLRTAKRVNLVVLVGLHHPAGGFAGTFQADFQPQDLRPDPTGWCPLQIPMTKLKAGMKDYPTLPPGGQIFLVYVACYFPDAGLEISEVSIDPPPAP